MSLIWYSDHGTLTFGTSPGDLSAAVTEITISGISRDIENMPTFGLDANSLPNSVIKENRMDLIEFQATIILQGSTQYALFQHIMGGTDSSVPILITGEATRSTQTITYLFVQGSGVSEEKWRYKTTAAYGTEIEMSGSAGDYMEVTVTYKSQGKYFTVEYTSNGSDSDLPA